MNILRWIHQKKWQNSIEPFKGFTFGNYCICISTPSSLDDEDYNLNPGFDSRYGSKTPKHLTKEYGKSTFELEAEGLEENLNKETYELGELFHGFLSIGTLGTETIISEPATPTFAISGENMAEEKKAATEYDLKLINDELEKFLEAEAEEENIESSGRNSYVSIITLCDKPMEGGNSKEYDKTMVCPLQGYLFGSSFEFLETNIEVKKEKTSLAELFQRTKIADRSSMEKYGKEEMPTKRKHKSVKQLVKKMLKRFHSSSKIPTPSDTDIASASTKKKLQKVIEMFHRKIHPENSIDKKELKSLNHKIKSSPFHDACLDGGLDKDNKTCPLGSKSMNQSKDHKANIKFPQYGLRGFSSSRNREQWIKTDADYLVLEL